MPRAPITLLAWELGAGTGHVMQAAPVLDALIARGHQVFAALRDPPAAHGLFHPAVRLLPVPLRREPVTKPRFTRNFADLLADFGYGDFPFLSSTADAWRNLITLVNPDLVLFDHAPTALLASRGLPHRRAVIGPGYNVPPDTDPFPSIRPAITIGPDELRAGERPLLDCANRVLAQWGQPPLPHLASLYGDVDATALLTFRELDYYAPHRKEVGGLAGDGRRTFYCGPILGPGGGIAPEWPPGHGPKLYAYLRPFPVLRRLLQHLAKQVRPSLFYFPTRPLYEQALRDFNLPHFRFHDRPLDLDLVAKECTVAITHGGHGTAAALLLRGVPALHLPLHPEMALNGYAVHHLGAGLTAPIDNLELILSRLSELMTNQTFRDGAQRFAAAHSTFDARSQLDRLADTLHELATAGPAVMG